MRRRKLPPPAASRVYELTEWGEELEPVIIRLGRWGARSPSKPRDSELGIDSLLVLSFRTMFDPEAADGFDASYELRLGEDHFRAVVEEGRFEIVRGNVDRPEAVIESDPSTLVYEDRSLDEALRTGDVEISGHRQAVERFLSLFSLPEPAPPARA